MSEHTPGYGAYYEAVREIEHLRAINAELRLSLDNAATALEVAVDWVGEDAQKHGLRQVAEAAKEGRP